MFSMIILIAFVNGTVLLPVILSFVGAGTIATHAHQESKGMEQRPSADELVLRDKLSEGGTDKTGEYDFVQLQGGGGAQSVSTFDV